MSVSSVAEGSMIVHSETGSLLFMLIAEKLSNKRSSLSAPPRISVRSLSVEFDTVSWFPWCFNLLSAIHSQARLSISVVADGFA